MINENEIASRFMSYVKIDTQSDPGSSTFPSTDKQKDLSRQLVDELLEMGIGNAEMDDNGYVYATIPSNSSKEKIPVICFCSHVDTAPDCSGTGVEPILHKNYEGDDIVLPKDATQVLKANDQPYLKQQIGSDIITASGDTLLGADDKAGVAIIMQAAKYLVENPQVKHGDIRILFTPDEEVGKGTAKLDMQKLGADFGYTLDGGEAGSLEDETFSADGAKIIVNGVIVHPGYAKGMLINAIKLCAEIIDALPKDEWSPETTSGREGFVHPVKTEGIAEKATVEFIVRDFTVDGLKHHHERLERIARNVIDKYPGTSLEYRVTEQYRNMKEVLDKHPEVIDHAKEAIKRSGLVLKMESIRGGTDGSRLSYMGLPAPNLFTGMQGIHSKLEWVGVKDLAKAAETVVHLATIWEEKTD